MKLRFLWLGLAALALATCGRPLTENEIRFAQTLHGDTLDYSRARFVDGAPTRAVTFRRPARPRVTCRERILPPPTTDIVTAKPAAVALWNRVLYDADWYLEDYLPDYPDRINLIAAMLYAHEITHIWQWQNRATTGYSPLRAAAEHQGSDPYLFDIDGDPQFLEFGFEQQASIVEEFVCCRALAPQEARTKRLHALLSQALPVAPLPQSRAYDVKVPWDGVEVKGICAYGGIMRHFDEIFEIAAARKGGPEALEAMLPHPASAADLAKVSEDRWLAQFVRSVFQAGFNWKVIDAKWDGFEEAFNGFDVGRCAFMDDETFDALLSDTRIVRNGTKIASVRDNAAFLLELREQGGAGAVLGGWPSDDFVGLLELLKKRGARLGGTTAQYALRFMERDSWIMSADVVARLMAEGVIDKTPTSKTAQRQVQAAFNTWMDQSGRGLTQISRVLAMSV